MARPDDIPAILRERFAYDPLTGEFTWRPRPKSDFPSERISKNWTTRFAGRPAFTGRSTDGYAQAELRVNGQRVRVLGHVAAFAVTYGRLPANELDHRNRDRSDNRIQNLREATRHQNNRNALKPGKHLPGARPSGSKWEARIRHAGKHVYLGLHASERDAHAAYVAASLRFHKEFSPFAGGGHQ